MAAPVVDTFEHDIANEIRHKEASITDIASAVGDIGNTGKEDTPSNNSNILIGIVLVLVLSAIVAIIVMGYLYYTGRYDPFAPKPQVLAVVKKPDVKVVGSFSSLYPSLQEGFGIYVTGMEKASAGYNISISSYSPVFSYMIKNEDAFKDEIGMSVNSQTKKVKTAASAEMTGSGTGSTTAATTTMTGTSTQDELGAEVTGDENAPAVGSFTDVTIDNQNMRAGESIFGPVVYAFVGTGNLVISSSTGGVLLIRNNILHK